MAALPADLVIFNILTRVPPVNVVRNKSVCKEWYTLLSMPYFEQCHCTQYTATCKQKTLLLCGKEWNVYPINSNTGDYGKPKTISIPFKPNANDGIILGHVNGLLCVTLFRTHELLLWNPTTTAYILLSTVDGHGFYEDMSDAIGLYHHSSNHYRLLHVTRCSTVLDAHIYSRQLRNWRSIPFHTKPEYIHLTFRWSPGTACRDAVYFTVCENWMQDKNEVLTFDAVTEQIEHIKFPCVLTNRFFEPVLLNVCNEFHMILSTGINGVSIHIWTLKDKGWMATFSLLLTPSIPLSVWATITHYVTNGNWFVMTKSGKLYDIITNGTRLECFYLVTWFRGYCGAVFLETIVSRII